MAGRFNTRPAFHCRPMYLADCECGWRCEERNAFGLAAQHHSKCGKRTRLELTRVFVWNANDEPPDGAPP